MLLADENVPAKAIEILRARGIDVVAIRELSPGIADEAVLDLAVAEVRILVSFDRDYGELIFKRLKPAPPSIVYLRFEPSSPDEVANTILHILGGGIGSMDGRMVIVTRQGVRERLFPKIR